MREATVRLQHKKKPQRIITVALKDYSTDLGTEKYRAYSLISENHNSTGENAVEVKTPDVTVDDIAIDPSIADEQEEIEVEAEIDPYKAVEEMNDIQIDDDEVKEEKTKSSKKKSKRSR